MLLGAEGHDRINVANNPVNDIDPFGLQEENALSGKIIVRNQNGVRIEHYGTADHGPAHAHVKGGGPDTRIGPKGHPLKNNPELSPKQRTVVEMNRKIIRKELNKLGRASKRLSGTGSKAIPYVGHILTFLDFHNAQKEAERRGVTVWRVMMEDMGVYHILFYDPYAHLRDC